MPCGSYPCSQWSLTANKEDLFGTMSQKPPTEIKSSSQRRRGWGSPGGRRGAGGARRRRGEREGGASVRERCVNGKSRRGESETERNTNGG
jgi:hypothetical protein